MSGAPCGTCGTALTRLTIIFGDSNKGKPGYCPQCGTRSDRQPTTTKQNIISAYRAGRISDAEIVKMAHSSYASLPAEVIEEILNETVRRKEAEEADFTARLKEAVETARRREAEEAALRKESARLKEAMEAARRTSLVRPYVGPAIMSFRDTSRSVLASGRSVAAHEAAAPREERAAQELALILDAMCKRGEFRDLSTVTRVLAKPTGQSVVFGGVYKGQQVAVKVFRSKTTKDDTAAKEVAYLQRCEHRHVLGMLKTYEFNGRALLVMPLAREDLQAVIERTEGPLPHAQVTAYMKQVATALAFLHDEKRVAHLDLKAGNVFIANDGRMLLADFGMAMDIAGSRDELLHCGTPMFMAPELWAHRLSEPVERGNRAKVDVYAFGCMVWQLLTRQLPFQREIENDGWVNNDFLLLATAVRRNRRSPGEAGMLETRWPEPLRRVIQTCCAYEPENRPTMAQVLAEYLR